jgi:hypothetical protein
VWNETGMTLLLVMVPVFLVGLAGSIIVLAEEIADTQNDGTVLYPPISIMLRDML